MLFKKSYGELVQEALRTLEINTDITNTSVGGITRSIIEVINRNIADYYNILDTNMAMTFVSTAEGYFLDLIGSLFNVTRLGATSAGATINDQTQKFYVTTGVLSTHLPSLVIPEGTLVQTSDGVIVYVVTSDVNFTVTDTSVYVPVSARDIGTAFNVGANTLTVNNLGINQVHTTNEKSIVGGTDTESDANYRFRIANSSLSAERANETAIRLAVLSVNGVANSLIRKYARGIGTYEVVIIPVQGVATDTMVQQAQSAIEEVQAYGINGVARAPTIVPVDISVKLVFVSNTYDYEQSIIKINVRTAIESYILNIPIGGEFILNELRQRIQETSVKIKDHEITCYFFRNQPHFLNNVEINWDELFYPNPQSVEAILVT